LTIKDGPMTDRATAAFLTLLFIGCHDADRVQPPENRVRMNAASGFTALYRHSRMSEWNVRGTAAGADCGVLLVQTAVIMDDSMVEAMHYGADAYDVYRGGVQKFSRDGAFRGVAYKDSTGHLWTYGAVSPHETASLAPCR
jgi:hypothetical protein